MIETLKCMISHHDGAHCGLGDWYPEIEQGIKDALNKGPKFEWTTGQYGSKKEIAWAIITCHNENIIVEVEVSNDFDTHGSCSKTIPFTTDLKEIRKAIYETWDDAIKNQEDNKPYTGFSIMTEVERYVEYSGGKGMGTPVKQPGWVETYIRCDDPLLPEPPGDYYNNWGFQNEYEIPEDIKNKFAEWAENWGIKHHEEQFVCDIFTIKPWND